MATFGELLGAEIREVRTGKSWTQLALAHRAFEPESAESGERRIREYESGKVKRPQSKVYVPLCDALGITHRRIGELKALSGDTRAVNLAEIDEIKRENGSLAIALANIQSLSRYQLDTLAKLFEIEDAHKVDESALLSIISRKADTYNALRRDIDAIDDSLIVLSKLKSEAKSAIENGDLERVDFLLSRVQEVELEEAAKTAELRASNALLRGRPRQALELLSSAADSFFGVNQRECIRRRLQYLAPLYSYAIQFDVNSIPICREILDLKENANATNEERAKLNGSLGVVLWQEALSKGEAGGQEQIEAAINRLMLAIEISSLEGLRDIEAKSQVNLAHTLQDAYVKTVRGEEALREAIERYSAAADYYLEVGDQINLAITHNSSGNVYSIIGNRMRGAAAIRELSNAVKLYDKAVEIHQPDLYPDYWFMATYNKAIATWRIGVASEERAYFLEAVKLCRVASRVRNADLAPRNFAKANMTIAEVLLDMLRRFDNDLGANLLQEARAAANLAVEYFRKCGDEVLGNTALRILGEISTREVITSRTDGF